MSFLGMKFDACVKDAEALIRLGKDSVWLDRDDESLPWSNVSEVSPGGMYRDGMSVSVHFAAEHPCGLTFNWSVDIEPRSMDGKGEFGIDVAKCHAVLAKLPKAAAKKFANHLEKCADEVAKRGMEFASASARQHKLEMQLRSICEATP